MSVSVNTVSAAATFGETLRSLRERAGFSQNGLAAAAGTDPGTVNRLESGKRAPVNRDLLGRIATALGLSSAEQDRLLALAGHAPSPMARLGLSDPDLLLVADILSDTSIADDERAEFRAGIRILARRWRAKAPAPTIVDAVAQATPAPGRPAAPSPPDPVDWGCWL